MRTTAVVKSHPIHPMLVGFPIAFLSAALVCDLAGLIFNGPRWWVIGAYSALAGIATGLVAAVPGLIDYVYSVPPDSSAKRRATYHMLVNVSSIGLFVVAWLLRGEAEAKPGWGVVAVEAVAMGLMTVGGWLGGTLVYRNMIGPEHRYADTGRWNEQRLDAKPGQPVAVARGDELKPDQMKLLHLDGKRIVLARTQGGYAAFDDHCSHRGASLADGVLICGKVQCLWHGSRFDVHTGGVENGPADKPISTYPVDVRDGQVWLTL